MYYDFLDKSEFKKNINDLALGYNPSELQGKVLDFSEYMH
jgi:hypothetical protein